MAAAVISIQSIAKPSTTEERIATMITNCQIQSGQTCELIMDAKPIVTSNIRFWHSVSTAFGRYCRLCGFQSIL